MDPFGKAYDATAADGRSPTAGGQATGVSRVKAVPFVTGACWPYGPGLYRPTPPAVTAGDMCTYWGGGGGRGSIASLTDTQVCRQVGEW